MNLVRGQTPKGVPCRSLARATRKNISNTWGKIPLTYSSFLGFSCSYLKIFYYHRLAIALLVNQP